MFEIYANLLGKWIKLDDSTDVICGSLPSLFDLCKYVTDDILWLEIQHGGKKYVIHQSQVQMIEL